MILGFHMDQIRSRWLRWSRKQKPGSFLAGGLVPQIQYRILFDGEVIKVVVCPFYSAAYYMVSLSQYHSWNYGKMCMQSRATEGYWN